VNEKGEEMKDSKKARLQTTLGELIATLCEETWPLLMNETETSIVVAYIFNDLLRRPPPRVMVGEDDDSG
jgi:hypothetical protein